LKKIDVFTHITSPEYLAALERKVNPAIIKDIPCQWLPALGNLDIRFKVMDEFEDYVQILTEANPPVENLCEPAEALELSRIANDELTELCAKYPDRFVGAVAVLPLNDMDLALKEAERAVKELNMCGIQIYNTVAGRELDDPYLFPLYALAEELDVPIWIHPMHPNKGAVVKDEKDFAGQKVFTNASDVAWAFTRSAFELPYETARSITRLIFSPVLNEHPDIKFILHHCGSFVPYMYGRLELQYDMLKSRDPADHGLKKPILDYYKMFYVDTALHGTPRSLMGGVDFYGLDHIMFGTDGPFDADLGRPTIKSTVDAVDAMDITEAERAQIYEGNVVKLLNLRI
jgi:aminocarboxymuconate-semialdehyde decarboxylase